MFKTSREEKTVKKQKYKHNYKCDICEKNYTSSTSLKIHHRAVHATSTYFHCNECGKSLSANKITNIKKHYNNVHKVFNDIPTDTFEMPADAITSIDTDSEEEKTIDEWVADLEQNVENEEESFEDNVFDVYEHECDQNDEEITENEKQMLIKQKERERCERHKRLKQKYDKFYSHEHVKLTKLIFHEPDLEN